MAPLQLPIGAVAARYSISTRTVDRWLADPRVGFPQPLRVRDRRYWRIADLESWERARAAGSVKQAA